MRGAQRRQKGAEEESRGREGRGGGELRLRSTRGKVFGCCSKVSLIPTMGRKGERVWRGWDGGVAGLKGNWLAREIEKECEGM